MSRILNRPMFRGGGKVSSYGNGIATGLADGGEVQPLLVGQHPESAKGPDGREKHGYPLLAGAVANAAKFLPAAYRGFKASRAYQPFSKNLGIMGRLKDTFLPCLSQISINFKIICSFSSILFINVLFCLYLKVIICYFLLNHAIFLHKVLLGTD